MQIHHARPSLLMALFASWSFSLQHAYHEHDIQVTDHCIILKCLADEDKYPHVIMHTSD